MPDRVFIPFDDETKSLSVGTSSTRVAFNAEHRGSNCRVCNVGDEMIFVKFGDASVVADTNDIPVPANWVELFGVPNDATHCAAIAGVGGNTMYITPGDGE